MTPSANSPLFRPQLLAAAVLAGVVLLPVAAWLDLRHLSDQTLSTQAGSLSSVIPAIRGYSTRNVVGRVLDAPGQTRPLHNLHPLPGALPTPAPLSIKIRWGAGPPAR